ncbi:signal peptidase I [bacterium]|nr:signal peptidase I [bacterium]
MSKPGNKEKANVSTVIRDWIGALILALVAALIFRTWFYTPYLVPTSSMIHTIQVGDHIFVNKHAYGYYSPFSDQRVFPRKVNRGDIVVFPYPVDPQVDYIKRVIGIGGDEIRIVGETVYVNGEPENTEYLYFDPELLKLPENIEVVVPEGKLWVMGDNRRNSKDSRYWGFVDETSIEGKAEVIFWSHDPPKNITEGYRFERIGTFFE